MKKHQNRGRNHRKVGSSGALFFFGLSRALFASTNTWVGTDGSWSDAASWSTGQVPRAGDVVQITQSALTLPITYDYSGPAITLSQLNVETLGASGLSNPDTVLENANTLTATDETFGIHGNALMQQSGGTNTVTDQLMLAQSPFSSGTYTLANQATLTTNDETIGGQGSGTFNQSGGTHTSSDLILGYSNGGSGSYLLSSGSLSAEFTLGYGGAGLLNQSGGSVTSTQVELGYAAGSSGNYSISGNATLTSLGPVGVGLTGTGVLQQSGGTVSAYASGATPGAGLALGYSGGTGYYNLSGGSLTQGYGIIGGTGSGQFIQSAGSNVASTEIDLGFYNTGTGSYTLSGGTLQVPVLALGEQGNGTLVQSGGVAQTTSTGVGIAKGAVGSLTIGAGSTFNASTSIIVGQSGVGTLTQTGGTITTGQLGVGLSPGAVGTVLISGTANLNATSIIVGQLGSGTINQTGGTVQSGKTGSYTSGLIVGYFPGSTSIYNQSGGTLTDTGTVVGYMAVGNFIQSGGTHNSTILTVVQFSGSGGSSYSLSNAAALNCSSESLGGTFLQANTSTNTTSGFSIGEGGPAVYNMTGGTLTDNGVENFAINANGTFIQTDGTHTATRLLLGTASPYTGTYVLGGGTVTIPAELIGAGGAGLFNQTGGTNNVTSTINDGLIVASGSAYAIGGGALNVRQMSIASQTGNAVFNQTGGTVTLSFGLYVAGSTSTYAGIYQLSGGLINTPQETLGVSGDTGTSGGLSTFLQSGGTNSVTSLAVGNPFFHGIGTYTLSGGVLWMSGMGISAGSVFKQTGGTISSDASANVAGTATFVPLQADGSSLSWNTLSIANGGQVNLSGSAGKQGVVQVSTLSLGTNATLDLSNNAMIVHGSSLAQLAPLVQSAFANGAWNGLGITSSAAASDTTHLTAIGVISNSFNGSSLYTTFDGQPVVPGDTLVADTYYGDANLDGRVDASDYSRIDNAYLSNGSLTGWFNGDFNYDGIINGSDYTLIDNAFNLQGSRLIATSTAQIAPGSVASVPEPIMTCGLIVGLSLLRRRYRCSTSNA